LLGAERTAVTIGLDEVIDRHALAGSLPAATALAFSQKVGGSPAEWEAAYRKVLADWDSYWDDLTLNEDDSLEQWREGRWRVYAALFRLTGWPVPPREEIASYLDDLQQVIGAGCSGWRPDAIATLKSRTSGGQHITINAPNLPAGLIRGMLQAAGVTDIQVTGPDEAGKWMG
jgi:hypothetical protein